MPPHILVLVEVVLGIPDNLTRRPFGYSHALNYSILPADFVFYEIPKTNKGEDEALDARRGCRVA